VEAADEFYELTTEDADVDKFAADDDGCQMGLLYRTLPYKHLSKWLSLDLYIGETDPYFDYTVLLQRDDEGRDYDVQCKQLQGEAIEEWKRIAASHTGSDLWRAQMKHHYQAMEAGAAEFLHWELSSKPVRFHKKPLTTEQHYTALETSLIEKGLLSDANSPSCSPSEGATQESSDGRWGEEREQWRVEIFDVPVREDEQQSC